MAGTYNVIPLDNSPNQSLTVTIPINGQNITLNLDVSYNSATDYWWLTISDRNNNLILDGVPLLCGEYPAADILGQCQYLGLGSAFVVNAGNTALDSPDDTSLGDSGGFYLLWGDSITS